jgi:hypothetical protein
LLIFVIFLFTYLNCREKFESVKNNPYFCSLLQKYLQHGQKIS